MCSDIYTVKFSPVPCNVLYVCTYIVQWLCNQRNLSITWWDWPTYVEREKVSYRIFLALTCRRFHLLLAHRTIHIIYSMAGGSIACMYTSVAYLSCRLCLGKYDALSRYSCMYWPWTSLPCYTLCYLLQLSPLYCTLRVIPCPFVTYCMYVRMLQMSGVGGATKLVTVFILSCAGLLGLSYHVSGSWDFLRAVYGVM